MVRHHPAVRQINVCPELNRYHFWIDLNDDAAQPAAYAFTALVMIAKYFHAVADIKRIGVFRGPNKRNLCHKQSP